MAYGITGIDKVRATVWPAGYMKDGTAAALSGMILVRWKSGHGDKLFQVYVNGERAGVTSDPEQREILVQYDHAHTAVIEVVWVTAEDKFRDWGVQLTGCKKADGSHAVVCFSRRGTIPLGSEARLFGNGGSGEINFEEILDRQVVWLEPTEKWGWGLDAFGQGDFGYSGTGAVGWGRGSFGNGEFGFDAELLSFESDELAAGRYRFAVRLADESGNMDEGEILEVEMNIDPLPVGPGLSIDRYDDQTEGLVLNIS